MGLFSRLFAAFEQRSLENPSVSLADHDAIARLGVVGHNDAGVEVTPQSILAIPAVWRGLHIISDTIGKLVPYVYKEDEDGREKAKDHPAYYILSKRAGKYLAARDLRKSLIYHALVYGNGYAFILRDGYGPVGMRLLPAWNFQRTVMDNTGEMVYVFLIQGREVPLLADDVFHIKGLSNDCEKGESMIQHLANALGVSLAEQKYAATYFGKGVLANTVVTIKDGVERVAVKEITKDLRVLAAGMHNAHGLFVLPPGSDAKTLNADPKNTQLLESRGFSVKQIANILGVPPHLLGEGIASEKSLEAENQSFLDHSIDPWLDAFEDEAERKLLTAEEQLSDEYCVEFDRSRLLKTDIATRYKAYSIGRQWGWWSVNEIRREEGRASIKGGDVYLQPGNMIPITDAENPQEDLLDDPSEDDPGSPDAEDALPGQVAAPMKNPGDATNTGAPSAIRTLPDASVLALAAAISDAALRLRGVREKRLLREKTPEKVLSEVRAQVGEIVTPLLRVRFDESELENRVGEFLSAWDAPDVDLVERVRELLK